MATTKISRLIQLAKFQARLLSPRVSNCLICSSMNPLVFISYLEFYLIHHADEFKYSCTVKVPKKASGSIPDFKEWAPLPEALKLVHSEGPNPVVHCSPLKTWLFGRWKHMSFTVSCYIMLILRRPHGSKKRDCNAPWLNLDRN